MKIFETHAHYDDESFNEDRDHLITEMLGASGIIDSIVNIGASLKGCKDSLALAAKYDKGVCSNWYSSIRCRSSYIKRY